MVPVQLASVSTQAVIMYDLEKVLSGHCAVTSDFVERSKFAASETSFPTPSQGQRSSLATAKLTLNVHM